MKPSRDSFEITLWSRSPEETFALAEKLGSEHPLVSSYYLEGELGAGKTLFTKGLASSYGVDPGIVVSPTFALVNRYSGGRVVVYHVDLYRIESERELRELGLEEIEAEIEGRRALLVVEWAEKLGRYRREDATEVLFEVTGEAERKIVVRSPATAGT